MYEKGCIKSSSRGSKVSIFSVVTHSHFAEAGECHLCRIHDSETSIARTQGWHCERPRTPCKEVSMTLRFSVVLGFYRRSIQKNSVS